MGHFGTRSGLLGTGRAGPCGALRGGSSLLGAVLLRGLAPGIWAGLHRLPLVAAPGRDCPEAAEKTP